jgi:hypothetical protein
MNTNIDFKELWNKQEATIPDKEEFFEKIKKFRMDNFKKIIITNILLILTSAFIVFIWHYYQPDMLSTKIGIVLTILAMVLYMFVYNQMIPILINVKHHVNNSQYLQQLLELKNKQLFLQNTMLTIYFVLLSLGICMYMFEYALRMALIWTIFSYGLVLVWVSINWFYFRPKTIKKQQTRINELISKFENISKQLHE